MFADAYEKATSFTHSVVISRCTLHGKCESSIGAFVVVNPDGWIVTAGHIVALMQNLGSAKQAGQGLEGKRAAIETDNQLGRKQKRQILRQLERQASNTVKDFSFWWGWDGVRIDNIAYIPDGDIAVGQLIGFNRAWVTTYPVFKDPSKGLRRGTSLCRMGYPFHEITPTYANGSFSIPGGTPALFPIEGIFTRQIRKGAHAKGFTIGFLETSSPGLMGQSGGPILDVKGTIWAIQSQTIHLALGFNPPVPGGRSGEVEHQFLNAGWGTHPETILGLLQDQNIAATISTY
jgi:hypothetical protein